MSRSSLQDFETVSRLGAGSFGTVFKVRRYADEEFYVIKNVRIAELGFKEQTEAINEVQILAQLKSAYVVRYYDSFIENDSLHIVMEFCNRGDLQLLLKRAREKNVPSLKESVVWNICLQIILGLHYLHRKHILHRDLKCANVFLTRDPSSADYLVKIGDLGVAKLMDTSTALASTIVGTPYYLSPELCKDLPYRDKSDCWALGVIMYECVTLRRPFEARNQCALIMKIIEAPVAPPSADLASAELVQLVLWLLQKEPAARPSTKQILDEAAVRDQLRERGHLQLPDDLESASETHCLQERQRALRTVEAEPKDSNSSTTNNTNSNSSKKEKERESTAVGAVPRGTATGTGTGGRVRGDRVRGAGGKRVPSERALSRYQLRSTTSSTSTSASAAPSSSGTPSAVPAAEGKEAKDRDDDDRGGDKEYEDDFEDDEEVDEEEAEAEHPSGGAQQMLRTQQGPFSAQSTADVSHALHPPGGDEDDLWDTAWRHPLGGAPLSPATEEEVEEGVGAEPLRDLIAEAKAKAVAALGEALFWRVYDLCAKHMGSAPAEDAGEGVEEEEGVGADFMQDLEEALQGRSQEAACEAVFGVKLLLALESKHALLLRMQAAAADTGTGTGRRK